ncbi:unnamed protein product [Ectocarpus sp. CCAP 1310/34]|nr:unnamed protein product [Ectocarpus sp. CCAP 1310/34]
MCAVQVIGVHRCTTLLLKGLNPINLKKKWHMETRLIWVKNDTKRAEFSSYVDGGANSDCSPLHRRNELRCRAPCVIHPRVRPATCTKVVLSDFGDFSGTYAEVADTSYDKQYSMAAGVETYSIYLDNGAWNMQPIEAVYPRYRTYDDASNPADITLEWVECDNSYCDFDIPSPSPIVITCSGTK